LALSTQGFKEVISSSGVSRDLRRPSPLRVAARFHIFDPLVERGMGSRLAGEQEMKSRQQHLPAEGLMRVEIVAQQGGVTGSVTFGVASQRLAALISQSCLNRPSCGVMNSGRSGTT
jgi:hypothetical protein